MRAFFPDVILICSALAEHTTHRESREACAVLGRRQNESADDALVLLLLLLKASDDDRRVGAADEDERNGRDVDGHVLLGNQIFAVDDLFEGTESFELRVGGNESFKIELNDGSSGGGFVGGDGPHHEHRHQRRWLNGPTEELRAGSRGQERSQKSQEDDDLHHHRGWLHGFFEKG
jgi:hypothetical protein